MNPMSEDLIQSVSQTVMNDVEELDNPQGAALVTFGDGAIPSLHAAQGRQVDSDTCLIAINALMETAFASEDASAEVKQRQRNHIAGNIKNPPKEIDAETTEMINDDTEQNRYPFRWGSETVEIVASEEKAEEIMEELREAQSDE